MNCILLAFSNKQALSNILLFPLRSPLARVSGPAGRSLVGRAPRGGAAGCGESPAFVPDRSTLPRRRISARGRFSRYPFVGVWSPLYVPWTLPVNRPTDIDEYRPPGSRCSPDGLKANTENETRVKPCITAAGSSPSPAVSSIKRPIQPLLQPKPLLCGPFVPE